MVHQAARRGQAGIGRANFRDAWAGPAGVLGTPLSIGMVMPDRTLGPTGTAVPPLASDRVTFQSRGASLIMAKVAATATAGGAWPDYVRGAVTMSFGRPPPATPSPPCVCIWKRLERFLSAIIFLKRKLTITGPMGMMLLLMKNIYSDQLAKAVSDLIKIPREMERDTLSS